MNDSQIRSQMQAVLDGVIADIGTIRTGRATPTLVDGIEVAVYGGQQRMKIREVASITAPDTNMLIIDPWDKSIIGEIKQGLLAANAGFTPNIDGEIIRIVLPPMTSEDRERYVKMMFAKLEDGKVKIRQVRADGMHTVKKDFENKVITEDEKFAGEKKIQQFTDEFIEKIEAAGEKKKAELLQI